MVVHTVPPVTKVSPGKVEEEVKTEGEHNEEGKDRTEEASTSLTNHGEDMVGQSPRSASLRNPIFVTPTMDEQFNASSSNPTRSHACCV